MKNKLILSVLGLAVLSLVGVNIYLNSQAQKLSDLSLVNIEASAGDDQTEAGKSNKHSQVAGCGSSAFRYWVAWCCPGYEQCTPKDQCDEKIIGC